MDGVAGGLKSTECDLGAGSDTVFFVHELGDAVGAEADGAADVGTGQDSTDEVVHVAQ